MFKKTFLSLILFSAVFGFYSLMNFSFPVLDSRVHGPIIRNKNGTSTNWSGYAVYGGTATDVKGSWTVPSLSCGSTNTYSSAWVGIDGYNDNSVEQTGTEQDCINGSQSFYAWYEMYPKPGYKLPLAIKAGDVINGEVAYKNGSFVLTLKDVTTGNSYSLSQRSNKAQKASAEWIMEAPYSGGILPLADFGTAYFTNSNATLNNISGPISAFTKDQINMVNSGGALKDTTSSLDSSGTNFSVTWVSSN